MIQYLIWDVDGTLFDTYPAITEAFCAALAGLGAAGAPDEVMALARSSLSQCAATLAQKYALDGEELSGRFHEHYRSIPLEQQPPFPGAPKVCGYICSVGGLNAIASHRGRRSVMRLLATHHLSGYFADILGSDDPYPRKPAPDSFEALIAKGHMRREAVLAIGDRDIDILAGQAAGVRTCLYGAEPGNAAADFAITDYAQLYQILVAENQRV